MDAVKFLRAEKRMCQMYMGNDCKNCPLDDGGDCIETKEIDPKEYVARVEAWAIANPVMTNAEKFHEIFGDNLVFSSNTCNCNVCHINGDNNIPCSNCDWWNEERNETKKTIGF